MPLLSRILDLTPLLAKKSIFLFGPRSTGKSTLVRETFASAFRVDLLNAEIYLRLTDNPTLLEEMHPEGRFRAGEIVVVDEIQRIPSLLNEVHRLIELRKCHFLLTGSSARKLRRGEANLLAGRAWIAELYPLVSVEIPGFELQRHLRYGGLPQVCTSTEPAEELNAYVNVYLKEEVLAEGLVRKVPAFLRFLRVAALGNSQQVSFQSVANDCGVAANTVRDHYSILVDTLIGFFLEPWRSSRRRKAVATSKFYWFDSGVFHTLIGTGTLDRNSNLYGVSFEQFLAQELRAYLSYRRKHTLPLTYWRSQGGMEVDFLVGDQVAIEVKATSRAAPRDKRGLLALQEEKVFEKLFFVSQDRVETKTGGIHSLHWETFLDRLWHDEVVT